MNWCYGCMEQIEEGQRVCPHCGFDNSCRQNDESLLREGSILNGKYLVGRKLGQGGFGVTYLGIELNLNIKVAIKEYFQKGMSTRASSSKMVKVSNDGVGTEGFLKGRDAFQKEAQMLALFDSPSIAHVREYFLENNTAYIVMDYVDGIGLDEAIRESGGRMPWQRVISLMMGLMPDLDLLHQKNLVHRDIKPANLKVVTDETTGKERLVLLDFGAARNFASAELTGTFTMILTAGYAPFEQYQRRSHQGPYTDVYALCATMYKCITGTIPPAAPDRVGDYAEQVVPITVFGLDVPEPVGRVIMHGLEFKPENRPQTMRELYDEFSEAVKEPEPEPDPREAIYQQVKNLMEEDTADSCKQALELFDQISGFEDADQLRNICLQKVYEFQSRQIYDEARAKMSSNKKADYEEALRLFTQITGYRDSYQQAEICRERIRELDDLPVPEPPKKKNLKPLVLLLVILAAAVGIFMFVRSGQEKQKAANLYSTHEAQTRTAESKFESTRVAQTETARYKQTSSVQMTSIAKAAAMRIPTPIPTATMMPTPSAAELYSLGLKAYNNKDYDKALEYWLPAAEAGSSNAQFGLGYMYSYGEGVDQLGEKALEWYQKAADQGHSDAQVKLGKMYYEGEGGLEKDPNEAVRLFRLAADQNNSYGQTWLGFCYEHGIGVEVDYKEALHWYQLAADQGYEEAKGYLDSLQNKMNATPTPIPTATMTPTSSAAAKITVTPTPKRSFSNSGSDFSNLKEGDIITFGRYEQDNNSSNGPEPIEWLVLDIKEPDPKSFDFFSKVLLISQYGLDTVQYHNVSDGITWEKCSLRKWLNDDFYNKAFIEEERKFIESVNNINPDVKSSYVDLVLGGKNTIDNIFLLSIDEINKYLPDNNSARLCKATSYAESKGASVLDKNGNTDWWLRSPGDYSRHAKYVSFYGYLMSSVVYDKNNTIRPALWVSMSYFQN